MIQKSRHPNMPQHPLPQISRTTTAQHIGGVQTDAHLFARGFSAATFNVPRVLAVVVHGEFRAQKIGPYFPDVIGTFRIDVFHVH